MRSGSMRVDCLLLPAKAKNGGLGPSFAGVLNLFGTKAPGCNLYRFAFTKSDEETTVPVLNAATPCLLLLRPNR